MTILLGRLKIDYPPLRPSSAAREEIALAYKISDFLLRRFGRLGAGGGSRSTESPDAWAELAEDLGCRVIAFYSPGAGQGEYASTRDSGDTAFGVITYNTASTRWMQVKTLLHEISHHVLVRWGIVPPTTEQSVCRNTGGDNFPHRVARMVETIVLG